MTMLSVQMAKMLENKFIGQFQTKIGITAEKELPLTITDPRSERTYRVKNWVRKGERGKNHWYPFSEIIKLKEQCKQINFNISETELRNNYPINAGISANIGKGMMVIEVRTLTPWKDLLNKEKNKLDQEVEVPPLTFAQLNPILNMVRERAAQYTYVLGIGSTSGWKEDMPEKIKRYSIKDMPYLLAIIDLYSNNLIYSGKEFDPFIDYFGTLSVIEVTPIIPTKEKLDVKKVKEYIDEKFKEQNYIFRDDKTAFETNIDEKFVKMAFKEILEKDGMKGVINTDKGIMILNLDKYQYGGRKYV